jgi:hypothetical protein
MHSHLLHRAPLPSSHCYFQKWIPTHARLDPVKSGNLEPLQGGSIGSVVYRYSLDYTPYGWVLSLSLCVHYAPADG